MMPSILVVEDEPAIQELLRVNLEDAGFAVRTVADAEAALGEIRRALPDLLLLDWMLPGQSGLALARGLRGETRTRELPIIMVTARGDEADRVAGLEAWVDDYITKPFSPRELKQDYTIAIVTHNMQQAARVSDYTAYMYLGELIEFGATDELFLKPRRRETEDYITGRFG